MTTTCPHCARTLDLAGDAPTFCAYCGKPLAAAASSVEATAAFVPSTSDTTAPLAAAARPVPASVGGYRVVRPLGQGGMGTVYEAVHPESGQAVAIKVLTHPIASTPAAIERFRQEGKLASLVAHPRCVFVIAADEEAGLPYIVMERMPGGTLRDRVQQAGPLPPRDAVRAALDVIDGLSEAHRQNVLHRDVKPSNCFLMPDGRVKVGDFGLSKSLGADANLTQTGAFLGTVLYASPEQLKGEPLDFASDVYSVAATLYYLLVGQAPFQSDNPTAVIAKAIAEPPPPMRKLRPDVPRDLERVVLRGLERSRERRYPTLGAFRAALEELQPGPLTRGSQGVRFAALAIDGVLVAPLVFVFAALAGTLDAGAWLAAAVWFGPPLVYFALGDGLAGGTVGKWAMRLRVVDAHAPRPPGALHGLGRALLFVLLAGGGVVDALELVSPGWAEGVVPPALTMLGWLGILAPMRRRNGYRGGHELLTGTQVVQLPWPRATRSLAAAAVRPDPLPAEALPASFGAYTLSGVWVDQPDYALLHARDAALGRDVHLVIDPADHSVIAQRRALTRPSRPRWLGAGTCERGPWNAYLAPSGAPLAALSTPGNVLRAAEVYWLLDQLAEELAAGLADGSLPDELHLNQVWLLPDARAQLLDYPLPPADAGTPVYPSTEAGALAFLREVALVGLEGTRRAKGRATQPVRAIVPLHAVPVLERLVGVRPGYWKLAEFRADLDELRDRPVEVTASLRGAHLGIQALLLGAGVLTMLLVAGLAGALLHVGLADRQAHLTAGAVALDVPPPGMTAAEARGLQTLFVLAAAENAERLADHEAALNPFERAVLAFAAASGGPPLEPGPDPAAMAAVRGDRAGAYRVAGHAVSGPQDADAVAAAGLAAVLAWPLAWVAWAVLFRGGVSWPLAGLAVVDRDGRPAARWRCGLRAVLVWLPFAVPLAASTWLKLHRPGLHWLTAGLWWAAVAYLATAVMLALARPQRAVHDRVAGTWLVPA